MRHVLSILVAGLVGFGGVARANPVDPNAFLQLCGGTRVIVAPFGAASRDEMDQAARVIQQRISAWAPRAYVKHAAALELGFPIGTFDRDALDASLVRGALSFHKVLTSGAIEILVILDSAEMILPDAQNADFGYVLEAEAVVDNTMIADAHPSMDDSGKPSVEIRFTEGGDVAFGPFTTSYVGGAVAIVFDRQVLSAPTILTPMTGGPGMIIGNFTATEVDNLAVILRSGALPVDLVVEKVEEIAGSAQAGDPLCAPIAAE